MREILLPAIAVQRLGPWLVAGLVGCLLASLASCQPSVPGLQPQSPGEVALQGKDVPGDLQRCPGSGDVAGYLGAIKDRSPDAYRSTSEAWKKLQSSGAKDAAIVTYAHDPSACNGELGVGAGRSATAFVIRYGDEGSAASAWKRGIAGFPTPAEGQVSPGLSQGVETGLGSNSWVYQTQAGGRSVYVAFWQRKAFDILVLTADLTAEESQRAAAAADNRVR
jgi:hypothetical protein